MAYADDIIILAKTKKELKSLIRKVEVETRNVGLAINEMKSGYMIKLEELKKRKSENNNSAANKGLGVFAYSNLLRKRFY